MDNPSFVDQFDWEKEHAVQAQKLEEGTSQEEEQRLPALIVIKITHNDDQINKRTFQRTFGKRLQP
jgi:hypothetical protein